MGGPEGVSRPMDKGEALMMPSCMRQREVKTKDASKIRVKDPWTRGGGILPGCDRQLGVKSTAKRQGCRRIKGMGRSWVGQRLAEGVNNRPMDKGEALMMPSCMRQRKRGLSLHKTKEKGAVNQRCLLENWCKCIGGVIKPRAIKT